MTNREKYREQIISTILPQCRFGVDGITGHLFDCDKRQDCEDCLFIDAFHCKEAKKVWLELESDSDISDTDWNSVPIDTLIHITTRDGVPMVRHFAGMIGGRITYFADRRNSSDFKAIYPVKESDTVELELDKGR